MRTQVAIIGGGPAGLLLSRLLHVNGIESVVLERRSRDYVLARIRAGVLEAGTVDMLRQAQADERLDRVGLTHDGVCLGGEGGILRIDLKGLVGRSMTVYGQTEMTHDLYAASDRQGGMVLHEAEDVMPRDIEGERPHVLYRRHGEERRIDCDFICGCDGFHGISRRCIPRHALQEYEKIYPFGWLGVLSQTPPVHPEVLYTTQAAGFALCSMRRADLSRYYVQVPEGERLEDWPDARFWAELRMRLPQDMAARLVTGPAIEKSIAPLRSYIAAPMRWGRLFLAGDAAHIVPPTGAKGLNLAVSDVHYLFHALRQFYEDGDRAGLDAYSAKALARVWKASRFSWWMTTLLHRFPGDGAFGQRMQEAELAYLAASPAAQTAFAENYVGLPF